MLNVKKLLAFLLVVIIFENAYTQSLTDVARSSELTWYGIDFTIAKFIGFNQRELNNKVPNRWTYTFFEGSDTLQAPNFQNNMPFPQIANSNGKANGIRRAYGKKSLFLQTGATNVKNDTVDCWLQMADKASFIDGERIKSVVNGYHFSGSGYGVLLIVESVEKVSNSIFIWVAYINKSNGQVISTRRYVGGGYGRDNRGGAYYSEKGIDLVIKLSGQELKKYKK